MLPKNYQYQLLENNYNQALQGLFLTVILAMYFTAHTNHIYTS